MQGHAVDYTSFLRVFEDGNIWWLWRDAVRLGAGFLPVYDNRTMEVVLQPPDDLARVNERELIGAAKDARLNIELPKTYSRDGCSFVEAENFLRWLDRYITQTGSEGIAFPEELENLVKVRKLEAAASHPSKKEFESLTQALEGWFDKKLEELPEDLRQRVEAEIGHWPLWDVLSANQRRELARQSDYRNDPATEPERKFWWDHFVQLEKLEDELSGLEAISAVSAEGFMQKEARCKELRREIARMEKGPVTTHPPADVPTAAPPAPGRQDADQHPALRRGEKVYRGGNEITGAYNRHAGTSIKWPAIRLKREQGLNIVYEPHGQKEVPTLDHIDLLDFLDHLPR